MRYILIEGSVLLGLVIFVLLMCLIAKRLIWPNEPLHPSFVGSLLSSSGTIFAASMAWMIADLAWNRHQAEEATKAAFNSEMADYNFGLTTDAMEDLSKRLKKLSAALPAQATTLETAQALLAINVFAINTAAFPGILQPFGDISDQLTRLAGIKSRMSYDFFSAIILKSAPEMGEDVTRRIADRNVAAARNIVEELNASVKSLDQLIELRRKEVPKRSITDG